MQATINRRDFLGAVKALHKVADGRASIEILSHAIMRAEGTRAVFTATDLSVGCQVGCPAKVDEAGEATFPVFRMLEILRVLDDSAPVRIESDSASSLRLQWNAFRVRLDTLPAEDFPIVPEPPGTMSAEVDAAEFLGVLKAVVHAAGEVKHYKPQILIRVGNGIGEAAATDGHRLAARKFAAAGSLPETPIPADAVKALAEVLAEETGMAQLALSEDPELRILHLVCSGARIVVRPAESGAGFDMIGRCLVRAAENRVSAVADRKELLRKMRPFGDMETRRRKVAVCLCINGALSLERLGTEAEVKAETCGEGEVTLGVEFLQGALKSIPTDRVEISIAGPDDPIRIRPVCGGQVEVIMPHSGCAGKLEGAISTWVETAA